MSERGASPGKRKGTGPAVRTGLVVFFYLAAAIVGTWPLSANFTTHLPAGGNDLYQNVWNFWWWKTALFELHTSPYHTPFLYAPEGLDLTFHTHSPFNMLFTMPVNLLFGHVAAYNASVLTALFLCAVGGYLLVKELTGREWAALAGGLVFAFFPQHLEQLFEHVNLFSCQFIPFSLYFTLKLLRSPTAGTGILAGLFFALNALSSWHLGLLLLLLGFPVLLWYGRKSPSKVRVVNRLLLGGGVALLILLPFLWPLVEGIISGDAYYKKPLVYRPIDPAFLVLPPPQSTFLGPAMRNIYLEHRGNAFDISTAFRFQYAGFICFLGWTPIVLLFLLAWSAARRRERRGEIVLWFGIFLFFLLFALGSHLTFLGKTYKNVSLPQGWLQNFLFFRVLRVANRYLIPGSAALAVLVGFAVARLPRRVAPLPVLLIALEFLWVPFPLRPFPRWPAVEKFSADTRKGIVLDIPFCTSALHILNMVRQTVHGAPIVGGYAACVPPEKRLSLLKAPYLQGLSMERVPGAPRVPPPRITRRTLETLKEKGVGSIILKPFETRGALRKLYEEERRKGKLPFFLKHLKPARGLPARRMELIESQLERYLGEPAYEDEKTRIWLLDEFD